MGIVTSPALWITNDLMMKDSKDSKVSTPKKKIGRLVQKIESWWNWTWILVKHCHPFKGWKSNLMHLDAKMYGRFSGISSQYCWCFRNPANQLRLVVSLSHYLRRVLAVYPRWKTLAGRLGWKKFNEWPQGFLLAKDGWYRRRGEPQELEDCDLKPRWVLVMRKFL